MAQHARNISGSWQEWDGRSFRDASGILHPANIAALWTVGERKAVGLYPITETAIPADKVSTGWSLVYDADTDTVTRTHTLANRPPPPVPSSVTMFQAREQLRRDGLLATVDAAVAQADDATKLAWEYATALERTSPTVAAIAAVLNLTSEQMDTMFRSAEQITA